MPGPSAVPLVLTAEPDLRADLARLAAAAGATPEVVGDVSAGMRSWTGASLVFVGGDMAAAVARADPVRRRHVHVVVRGEAPDGLFREALGCGAHAVLTLPRSEAQVVDLLTDAADGKARDGVLVGVVGGAGGVGTTTFAAALALACAERAPALLIDGDVLGAGVDIVLGVDAVTGTRWDGLARPVGRLSATALRDALPGRDQLSVLSWPVDRTFDLPSAAVRDVLAASLRAFPVVVVDLPRHSSPMPDELLERCHSLVLVSTLALPAVSAAARKISNLPARSTGVVLRGRNGRDAAEVARVLGRPVLASMRDQQGLDEAVALGLGPVRSGRGPLARAARRVADVLAGGEV